MKKFSRRDVLKTSVLASAAATVHGVAPLAAAMEIGTEPLEPSFAPSFGDSKDESGKSGRERLLLDVGWRFHFGQRRQ